MLLSLLIVPCVAAFARAAQLPLLSSTLIDALSSDPDFTSLLHLIQRARLVPTLNRLEHSTLFAPTNDAIHKDSWLRAILTEDQEAPLTDNVQEKLRQQLFYHLINETIQPSTSAQDISVRVLDTMHYPRTPLEPPSRDPPPYPPWMPIPGGTLGGSPQRIRTAAEGDISGVGVDAFGNGGAPVVKQRIEAANGVVLGISEVLEPPPDLATVISRTPSLSYFNDIATPAIRHLLNTSEGLTLFLPVDDAWDALHPYERLYLESPFATSDLQLIVNMHAVSSKSVMWSDTFAPAVNLTTIDGQTLEIVETPKETTVSWAKLIQPDVYAANGVLHLVSSLLIPPGAIQITPEKHLLVLNCTTFVSLLHSSNLTHLINDTDTEMTILAPSDEILTIFEDDGLPEPGSAEMKKLLEYHFIPGKWTLDKLSSGMLLATALEEEGLGGDQQVLSVEVSSKLEKDGSKSIRFGGAGTIGSPVEVTNNTIIYFIARPLLPPADALQTALPSLDLSLFLAAISSLPSTANRVRTAPRTTLLIPHNPAFKRLGLLVSAHLLASGSKGDLERVLLHHTLDSVEYSGSLINGSLHSFRTLEGSDLQIRGKANGQITIDSSGGWEGMKSQLFLKDTLTQTGVIHELSDVLLPRSVDITIGKLVKAAQGSVMASMLTRAGYDWVLNGTSPPGDSPWADASWTLLCPVDDAFNDYNLTELYSDLERLKIIVSQHLVPISQGEEQDLISRLGSGFAPGKDAKFSDSVTNNNRPLFMDDSASYSTLRSPGSAYGDIIFRQRDDDDDSGTSYVVGIKGARGTDGTTDWARVQAWGRSTSGRGTGGVIQIDRMLEPYQPPWWIEWGAPTLVGFLGAVGICVFFYGVNVFWRRDITEATYEPVGGFSRDDDSES